jgi:hypothetical protein
MRTEINTGDSFMAIMGACGDTKIIWDKNNQDEVDNARRTFDDLLSKSYLAFSVKNDSSEGEQIKVFDPNIERMILSPQMKGG